MPTKTVTPDTWEVREPLRYGSRHVSFHATETEARADAEELASRKYPGHGLQIHTKRRVIYIDHDDV